MIASQLAGRAIYLAIDCHQHSKQSEWDTQLICDDFLFLSSNICVSCLVGNKILYVLPWWTSDALGCYNSFYLMTTKWHSDIAYRIKHTGTVAKVIGSVWPIHFSLKQTYHRLTHCVHCQWLSKSPPQDLMNYFCKDFCGNIPQGINTFINMICINEGVIY